MTDEGFSTCTLSSQTTHRKLRLSELLRSAAKKDKTPNCFMIFTFVYILTIILYSYSKPYSVDSNSRPARCRCLCRFTNGIGIDE